MLNLQVNKQQTFELLYDEPLEGSNKYGKYFCYALKNGDGTEYSFFAPEEVHKVLKDQKKGTKFQITKTAVEKNKKLITDYVIEFPNNGKEKPKTQLGRTVQN